MSTFTRCSSTPRADTLVNAAGSTLRTRPCSTPGPPQRSMRTGLPARTCKASVDKSGATTSSCVVSPSSTSTAPSATAPSLACATRSTRPDTGARTSNTRAPSALPGRCTTSSAARACARSARAARWSCCATSTSLRASSTVRRSASRRAGATKPCCANCSVRRASPSACSSAVRLRAVRTSARCTPACAASTRACCSRRLRASSKVGKAGVMRANTSPACTESPSRRSMRNRRPANGAETL